MPVFRSYTVLYNFRDKYIFLGHAVGCLQPGKRYSSIFFILSSLFCYIEKILWTTQNCVESTGQTHQYSNFKEFVLRKRLTEARNSRRKPTKNPFNRENFTEEERCFTCPKLIAGQHFCLLPYVIKKTFNEH